MAAAFSLAPNFQLPGMTRDEPFGPDWVELPEHVVAIISRFDLDRELSDAAGQLGLEPGRMNPFAADWQRERHGAE